MYKKEVQWMEEWRITRCEKFEIDDVMMVEICIII